MTNYLIQTKNLIKTFDNKTNSLDNLNINIPEGSVYGLLGKNGAGKTTTLRMFMSLLKPTSGELNVMGYEPKKMPINIRQQIGYASESMFLVPWLKVGQILNYNGSFYDNWDIPYVEKWLKTMEIPINKRVFSLSRGNRQKLSLLMAIGHRPKLLILDEPAGGLDPIARKEFLESLIELIHESGTTIVISSHLLSDIERVTEHIGMIKKGKVIVETKLDSLKEKTRQITIIGSNSKTFSMSGILSKKLQNNSCTSVISNWNDEKEKQLYQMFPEANIEINSLSLEEIFFAYSNN